MHDTYAQYINDKLARIASALEYFVQKDQDEKKAQRESNAAVERLLTAQLEGVLYRDEPISEMPQPSEHLQDHFLNGYPKSGI